MNSDDEKYMKQAYKEALKAKEALFVSEKVKIGENDYLYAGHAYVGAKDYDKAIEAFQKDLQNSISAYKQELMDEDEFECETKDCAYNHEGMCRFQRVHDRKPTITEDDGCVDSVIEFSRN